MITQRQKLLRQCTASKEAIITYSSKYCFMKQCPKEVDNRQQMCHIHSNISHYHTPKVTANMTHNTGQNVCHHVYVRNTLIIIQVLNIKGFALLSLLVKFYLHQCHCDLQIWSRSYNQQSSVDIIINHAQQTTQKPQIMESYPLKATE